MIAPSPPGRTVMLMMRRLLVGQAFAGGHDALVLLLMFVIPLFMALANVAEPHAVIDLGTELSHSAPPRAALAATAAALVG